MIKKLKSSLTAKIFLLTALLLTVCCVATYSFIVWMVPNIYPNQIDLEEVEWLADETAQELQHTSIDDYPFLVKALQEMAQDQFNDDLELHIFSESGFEVSLSDISEQIEKTISDYEADKRTQEYSVTFMEDTNEYYLIYVDSSKSVNQAMEALGGVFQYLIVTVLVISLLTSFIYSKYITAPIKKINRTSRKMATMDFNVKCDTNRTDEVGGVAENLNLLAEKLSLAFHELEEANVKLVDDINREKQMEKQRTELFSATSHELKTPITIIKGQLQGMIYGIGRYKDRDTYLVQSLESLTNLETMVQELLMVARMEAPDYTCSFEQFDLVALVKQCLVAQEDLFIQNYMELVCNFPSNLMYTGDQQLLKRVFDNLINNALAYSPQGNSIIVSLTKEDTGVKFCIENTGGYIDEKELPRLFEAFYRTEQSRNRQTGGSGLGLYIVKKVLDLHKARYTMKNTEAGVMFTITFSETPC